MHVGLAGFDTESIIRSMDRKGIDQSWLLTWEEINPPLPGLHMDLLPEPMLEAKDRYPDRFVPFYAPDPATENLKELFNRYQELGIRGCAELKVSRTWEDPLIESYLEIVQQYALPLVFHMENPRMLYIQKKGRTLQLPLEGLLNDRFNGLSRYYINQLTQRTGILKKRINQNQEYFPGILFDFAFLEKRILQFPGVKFIGHGPDYWNNISSFQHQKYIHQKGSIQTFGIIDRLLEEHDNFFCDISGTSGYNAMNRDRTQAKIFLQKHAAKILYGTDNTLFPLLELLHSMDLGKESLERILYKNALDILR